MLRRTLRPLVRALALIACAAVLVASCAHQRINSDAAACPSADAATLCTSGCTNLDGDAANCGKCGNKCDSWLVCDKGECTCPKGKNECGSACVDTTSDPTNCGKCNLKCSAGNFAKPACAAGNCTFGCLMGYQDCNNKPADGCEAHTDVDPAHCGTCANACPMDVANTTIECKAGMCAITACDMGFEDCDKDIKNGCEADLQNDPANCSKCKNACDAMTQDCVGGTCGPKLRPNVLMCPFANMQLSGWFPANAKLNLMTGCTPDNQTQALLITRSGQAAINGNLKTYLQNGGIVLTEYSISDDVYSVVFQFVPQGQGNGSCQDNAPTVVQFSANDKFWMDNTFMPIGLGQTGCGYGIQNFPQITPLAGWTAVQVGLGYRDLGTGRLWLTDWDWQDFEAVGTKYSHDLVGYMITHKK